MVMAKIELDKKGLWLEHQVVMLTTDRDGGRLVIATVGN
jgi:hypothetical protein